MNALELHFDGVCLFVSVIVKVCDALKGFFDPLIEPTLLAQAQILALTVIVVGNVGSYALNSAFLSFSYGVEYNKLRSLILQRVDHSFSFSHNGFRLR